MLLACHSIYTLLWVWYSSLVLSYLDNLLPVGLELASVGYE